MNVNVTLKTLLNQDCKKSLQEIPTLNNIVQVQKWNTIQLVYRLYTYVSSMIMTQIITCKIQTSFISSFFYIEDGLCMSMKPKLGALSFGLKV